MQNTKVTIVQSGTHLLKSTYPDKYRQDVEARLRRHGVDMIFDDRVETIPAPGAAGVTTRKGVVLPDADLVVSPMPR